VFIVVVLFQSFVDFFSRGLQQEYAAKGITIQVVHPYFVATKLSKIRKANLFVPSPTSFVHSALNTVGLQATTFGCWTHAVQVFRPNKKICVIRVT
jgi:17beta-estradiol 17-dehydrogenase / very-long-chain 3-oxoacyl-CoA reductase